jgi:hypothetical protein
MLKEQYGAMLDAAAKLEEADIKLAHAIAAANEAHSLLIKAHSSHYNKCSEMAVELEASYEQIEALRRFVQRDIG